MSIITTLAAGVLMSPANVAADVPASGLESPGYDWKTQKAVIQPGTEVGSPQQMASVRGTTSIIVPGKPQTIDDWNTWD